MPNVMAAQLNIGGAICESSVIPLQKFDWPPMSDVAVVTKGDAKPVEICWGAPNSRTDLRRQWAEVRHIVGTC